MHFVPRSSTPSWPEPARRAAAAAAPAHSPPAAEARKLPVIATVVVTRDRPRLLAQTLDAVARQRGPCPNRTVVVDNASGPDTFEVLKTAQATVVRSEVNLGGAGGFALGMQRALELGADWIWLMDDDAVPHADALDQLTSQLARLPADAAVACCQVLEFGQLATTHRRRFDPLFGYEQVIPPSAYGGDPVPVDTASFVGFLVSVAAVRAAGLPRAEFFLAYDDTEYSLRLKRCGFSLWLVPASVIVHQRELAHRLRATEFGPRHYFNVRNRIVVKRAYCRAGAVGAGLGALFGLALCLYSPGRFSPRPWRLALDAIRDGFAGRLGPMPQRRNAGAAR